MTDDFETIYDSDILDPEIAAEGVWVTCEHCVEVTLPAVDMVRQDDGAWICGGCDRELILEWEDQKATGRRG